MCIAIICFPVCDVINFEISLEIPIKLFSYATKKSGQKFKYIKNESFWNKTDLSSFLNGFQLLETVLDQKVSLKIKVWPA